MPRRGLATGRRWREALGGAAFGVIAPQPVSEPEVGGFSGWADAPVALKLRFRVGSPPRLVEVETDARERAHMVPPVMHIASLLGGSARKTLRFPITIEKKPLKLKAAGRARSFPGYAVGNRAVGDASVDGVHVTIKCPEGVPDGFAIARLDAADFDAFIRSERERWEKLRAPTPARRRRRSSTKGQGT